MFYIRPFYFFFLSLLISMNIYADEDELQDFRTTLTNEWQLAKIDKMRSLQMFVKQEDDKPYRSFKIQAILDCDQRTLYRVLLDFANYHKWYWLTKEVKRLDQSNNKEHYLYVVHYAPFDLGDRDIILHATIEPASSSQPNNIIRITAEPHFLPNKPPLMRMKAENMVITFQQLSKQKTQIEVVGYIDPGSNVPSWMINFIQRKAPYANILGLARMVQKSEYQQDDTPLPFYLSKGRE